MIIALSGKFRSGKDTVAQMISLKLISKNIVTRRVAFADSLKEIVEIITGEKRSIVNGKYFSYPVYDFTEKQKNNFLDGWGLTLGTMLQKLGTDVLRDGFNKQIWINCVINKIKDLPPEEIVIITDVRFKNELEMLKRKGCVCIRIEGDPIKAAEESTRNKQHQSETDLDDMVFDYHIVNDGSLEDLDKKINIIVDKFLTYDRHIYFTT